MDVFGNALLDLHLHGEADTLWLHNSYSDVEIMPVEIFYRHEDEMPELEHYALSRCYGAILDVGAGVGSHAIILQKFGHKVTAIDISENAVKIMQHRGVENAKHQDFFAISEKYDTLLFLMNGIGLTGTLPGFVDFLQKAKNFINPGGQLLFDSSDISYLYEDLDKPENQYFGEVSFCYEYKNQKGNWFNWLYLDQGTLAHIAHQNGWHLDVLFEDDDDQYLARLKLQS